MSLNTIFLKGTARHEEAKAGEAGIYPGMLLKLNSSGNVIKHSTSGGALGDEILVAEEDVLQGNTVDTVYTNGTTVSYRVCSRGDEVQLLIADGEDIAIGDKIMSGGDGTAKENSGGTHVIAVATEANDLSGSTNTANALSACRITG